MLVNSLWTGLGYMRTAIFALPVSPPSGHASQVGRSSFLLEHRDEAGRVDNPIISDMAAGRIQAHTRKPEMALHGRDRGRVAPAGAQQHQDHAETLLGPDQS